MPINVIVKHPESRIGTVGRHNKSKPVRGKKGSCSTFSTQYTESSSLQSFCVVQTQNMGAWCLGKELRSKIYEYTLGKMPLNVYQSTN
uniref:Uncharacterized protein n=1 Tax=Anguilla anguilla TaxID=7936 RepID=A0A0E9RIA4_ANGAN